MRQTILPGQYCRHPDTKNHSNNGVHNGHGDSNGFNHKPVSDPHEHYRIKKHITSLPNFNPPNKIRFTLHSKRQIIPSNKNEKNGDRNVGKVRNTTFNGSSKEYNGVNNGNGIVQQNILVETSGRTLTQLLEKNPAKAMEKLMYEVTNYEDSIIRVNAIKKLGELGYAREKEFLREVKQSLATKLEASENGEKEKINIIINNIKEAIKEIENRGF